MVYLKLTPESLARLKDASQKLAEETSTGTSQDAETLHLLRKALSEDEESENAEPPMGVIRHDLLIRAGRTLQRTSQTDTHQTNVELDRLLKGARLWFKPKPRFIRSPELESTLARIKAQQEADEYKQMLATSSSTSASTMSISSLSSPSDAEEWLEIRRQISALVNIFFSAVGIATATWWSLGEYTASHVKLASCLVSATAIVCVEAFLYARHFQRMKEKRIWKERAKRGKLTFVDGMGEQPHAQRSSHGRNNNRQ